VEVMSVPGQGWQSMQDGVFKSHFLRLFYSCHISASERARAILIIPKRLPWCVQCATEKPRPKDQYRERSERRKFQRFLNFWAFSGVFRHISSADIFANFTSKAEQCLLYCARFIKKIVENFSRNDTITKFVVFRLFSRENPENLLTFPSIISLSTGIQAYVIH
jgi:hypothetical protein